jgi:fucose 4-O-acetylase-like acetyltransferase
VWRRGPLGAPPGLTYGAGVDTSGRDRFMDLLRGGSIVGVVVGHWLVADVRWSHGDLADTSTLAEVPGMWPLTWVFLVIPLFFFVGGYANHRSWDGTVRRGEGFAAFVDRRLHRILAPTAVYLGVVAVAGVLISGAGGLGVGLLGGLCYQSLWFLGAYLWVVALVPLTRRAHARFGAGVLILLAVLIVVGDVGRFAWGVSPTGYLNILWVWLLMHQLGYFYVDGRLTRPVAATMAVLGLGATAVLVATPTYPGTMVAVPGLSEGNMHPPTVAVTTLGVGQIGVCVLLRGPLTRWLQRPRVWAAVVAVNLTVLSIFLWHQVALIVAARLVLPLGFPDPTPGSLSWWVLHMLWLLIPGLVLAIIVAVAGRAEQVATPRPIRPGVVPGATASVGVVIAGIGFLDLAGSSAMGLFGRGERLGPFTASPILGFTMLLAAAAIFHVLRARFPAVPRTRSTGTGEPVSPPG